MSHARAAPHAVEATEAPRATPRAWRGLGVTPPRVCVPVRACGRALGEKFVKKVGFSGATAVCRAGMGHVLEQPRSRQIYKQLLQEGVSHAHMS